MIVVEEVTRKNDKHCNACTRSKFDSESTDIKFYAVRYTLSELTNCGVLSLCEFCIEDLYNEIAERRGY